MTKLPRVTQKIFGNTAIEDNAIAQFGSVVAGAPLFTGSIEQIQALEYWEKGWVGATVSARRYPTSEETTGINKVVTQQLAYIFQEGIPEYDTGTTYPKGGWCKGLNADVATIYESLEDDNINNPLTDTTKWKVVEFSGGGGGLEVCDIGMALYIDETKGLRRYLNGQIVDINTNTQAFLNRLLQIQTTNPDYFTTEDNWQAEALLNVDGCVYKFVLNYSGDTVVSVRLPKYPDYVEIMADSASVSVYGSGAGTAFVNKTADNAFIMGIQTGNGGDAIYCSGVKGTTLGGTASVSGVGKRIIGLATQTQLKTAGITDNGIKANIDNDDRTTLKLRYFIQIATGSETENNIINEIELNNPFSLLDYKFSEYELNNISWLRSNGQYNSKAIYPAVYDLLLKIYNGTETKAGVSVKLSTETFTEYDFVLNTAEETFRLPIKVKLASGKAVVGNGMTLGLTNGTQTGGLAGYSNGSTNANIAYKNTYGVTVGNTTTGTSITRSLGVTTDPTKSGMELSDSDLYLYFYVGETVQNANLIDAGRIAETMATKSMVDGQWISARKIIFSDTTFKEKETKTYDLSDVLPDDGYDYECLFSAYIRTGNTSGNTTGCYLMSGATADTFLYAARVARCVTRTSSNANAQGSAILPILASDRAISWHNVDASGESGSCGLTLEQYRRIGKNV